MPSVLVYADHVEQQETTPNCFFFGHVPSFYKEYQKDRRSPDRDDEFRLVTNFCILFALFGARASLSGPIFPCGKTGGFFFSFAFVVLIFVCEHNMRALLLCALLVAAVYAADWLEVDRAAPYETVSLRFALRQRNLDVLEVRKCGDYVSI